MNRFRVVSLVLIIAAVALSGCGKPPGDGKGDIVNPGNGSGNNGSGSNGSGNNGSGNNGAGNNGAGNNGAGNNGAGNNGAGNNGAGNNGADDAAGKAWLERQKNSKDPKRNAEKNRPGFSYEENGKTVTNYDSPTEPDIDGDEARNAADNCPYDSNADQLDSDHDGVGDACDNCPDVPNGDQRNICDPSSEGIKTKGPWEGTDEQKAAWEREHVDSDGDGLPDHYDKCPNLANELLPGKTEGSKNPADYEGLTTDTDGDGYPDICDNCPDISNRDQEDTDGNGIGDLCAGTYTAMACSVAQDCIDANQGTECTSGQCSCGDQVEEADLLKPNVVLALDVSGSMSTGDFLGRYGKRINAMRGALDALADDAYDDFRFSILTFGNFAPRSEWNPVGLWYYDKCPEPVFKWLTTPKPQEFASSEALKSVWRNIAPECETPTGPALQEIKRAYKSGEFGDDSDGNIKRKTIVILLTDGEPTQAAKKTSNPKEEERAAREEAVNGARDLYDAGVEVYVVGMNIDTKSLTDTAKAGSGDKRTTYLRTNDADKLAKTIRAIADSNVQCNLKVNTDRTTNQIYVKVNGRPLSRIFSNKEFTYDPSTKQLELTQNVCNELNSVDNPKVEVILGCDTCVKDRRLKTDNVESEKAVGMCDGIDNDCDGVVDEGCNDCALYETCGDGIDNDCDGVVDNGCSDTKKEKNDDCERDSDCEEPLKCVYDSTLKKKVCKGECVQIASPCGVDDECCGGFTCSSGICSVG